MPIPNIAMMVGPEANDVVRLQQQAMMSRLSNGILNALLSDMA